ncbi:MAG: hypothetical protein Ta2E_08620 [Mycoplasmoidaceae bacterium]|nr:MAG: hypothetical protein Ta2E_08620 [Mycoplasmoidaceae bacterium]
MKKILKISILTITLATTVATIAHSFLSSDKKENYKSSLNSAPTSPSVNDFTFNFAAPEMIWRGDKKWTNTRWHIVGGYTFTSYKMKVNFKSAINYNSSDFTSAGRSAYWMLQNNYLNSLSITIDYSHGSDKWNNTDNNMPNTGHWTNHIKLTSSFITIINKSTGVTGTNEFSPVQGSLGDDPAERFRMYFKWNLNNIKFTIENSKLTVNTNNGNYLNLVGGNYNNDDTYVGNSMDDINIGKTSGDYVTATSYTNIDLDETPEGKIKSEPDMATNNKSRIYNKYPFDIKKQNAPANPDIVVPEEASGFESSKVIKMYYEGNSMAYFNYLDKQYTAGFGNRDIYGSIYKNTTTKYILKFWYDTIAIDLNTPEFYLSFDILRDLPANSTIQNLINGNYISNLKNFTNKNITWQLFSDTLPRHSAVTNTMTTPPATFDSYELATNNPIMHDLTNAVAYENRYNLSQSNSEYDKATWTDTNEHIKITLNPSIWSNMAITNVNEEIKAGFSSSDKKDNLQKYLSYTFKYVKNKDTNNDGIINDNESKIANEYLVANKNPDWVEDTNTELLSEGSAIEDSHNVLDHVKLFTRDNKFNQIEETTENIADLEAEKTFKAKMRLELNNYYLKQVLAGYDIATVQSRITMDDYRTKLANWTLKFDKNIIDKDNELWNFLAASLKSGRLIDINKSQVIDYVVPNTSIKYFAYDEMLKYDINYFLNNCEATTFIDFKNQVNALESPFLNFINWNNKKNLLDEMENIFYQTNNLTFSYAYSENYNSLIIGNNNKITMSWTDFINNGVVLETPGHIRDSNPATLRINNIVASNNFDSYQATSKNFGMVKNVNENKNSLGINFVVYQNKGEWYDPDDITDPNHPDYKPDPNNPLNPINPDVVNKKSSNGVNTKILLVVLFAVLTGGGVIAAATVFAIKRKRATANLKRG